MVFPSRESASPKGIRPTGMLEMTCLLLRIENHQPEMRKIQDIKDLAVMREQEFAAQAVEL